MTCNKFLTQIETYMFDAMFEALSAQGQQAILATIAACSG